jgi:hypothetical protein
MVSADHGKKQDLTPLLRCSALDWLRPFLFALAE